MSSRPTSRALTPGTLSLRHRDSGEVQRGHKAEASASGLPIPPCSLDPRAALCVSLEPLAQRTLGLCECCVSPTTSPSVSIRLISC